MNNLEHNNDTKVILIEPFFGGSHKELINILIKGLNERKVGYFLVTLPAKKWHWRARCGVLQIYNKFPIITTEQVLWCSSVLNLAELIGLRPDIIKLKKIVYFHENQLIYPVQEIKFRDVQYSYNQIMTCLSANLVVFNSNFNMISFLDNIKKILKLFPDNKPNSHSIKTDIEKKSIVLYFPVNFPIIKPIEKCVNFLHIVWPHRWEFDKGPNEFFDIIFRLKKGNYNFKLSVLGETYKDVPDIFNKAKNQLKDEIINFGYVENKDDYYKILNSSHVTISTSKHEFFGVSMIEAAFCGSFVLVPNNLVYPEIYPVECLYEDFNDLYEKLELFCKNPQFLIDLQNKVDWDFIKKYSCVNLLPKYLDVLGVKCL